MIGKIFCVGRNKTGTTSLHHMFLAAGLKSYHGKDWMKKSFRRHHEFDAFSDGMIENEELQRLSNNQTAKFILNTRPLHSWLVSRCKHAHRGFVLGNRPEYTTDNIAKWARDRLRWNRFVQDTVDPVQLFVFNIEQPDVERLSAFLTIPSLTLPRENAHEADPGLLEKIQVDVHGVLDAMNVLDKNIC